MFCEVFTKILPPDISAALNKLNPDKLYEVRLRGGSFVSVGYGDGYYYLSQNGTSCSIQNAIFVNENAIQQIVLRACDKSLYAVNDHICRGYLTLDGGVRIGIAGTTVLENGNVKTVKNFSSVNIRVPHQVVGCGCKVAGLLQKPSGKYYSSLIVSPPGAGKTTLLRDLARIASTGKRILNVLIVDERDEIAAVRNGKATLDVGKNSDVISGCTKAYAFINAVRALRPDIIITDELCDSEDADAVENAIASGVCVFASIHADTHERISDKPQLSRLIKNRLFERYVDLSCERGIGTVSGIYDKNFNALPFGEPL